MNRWLQTILLLLLSAVLTRLIPFSSLFRNLDTMIHEFGHALATLLLSGQVLRIELYADHSGVTYSSVAPGLSAVAVSLAGYLTASLFALLLFYLYARKKLEWGLMLSVGLALIMLALYVRGTFGMAWLAGFVVLSLAVLLAGGKLLRIYYLLLAFLTLEESVAAPFILLRMSLTAPSRAGDAANLARLTSIPALVWSLLFLAAALLCAMWALKLFTSSFRTRERSRRNTPRRFGKLNP
ncbi:M50 family metallopeptidase [Paenibacillus sp. CN-4]|uniref:M50 family metallopeptidase n=1 Tax=Paenibacillus nanchangensis TaxID=3348343 RepID=UPI00397D36AE